MKGTSVDNIYELTVCKPIFVSGFHRHCSPVLCMLDLESMGQYYSMHFT